MAFVDSQKAIGAVSGLLRDRITLRLTGTPVSIGRPEDASKSAGPRLNLFLYRVGFDASLRNHPLDTGQQPPIWLVLYYLLTAFDDKSESDSANAHALFGRGILALQGLNFLRPTVVELMQNPEPLKITFDEADVDLLSKLMQGSDEKYRCSAAFQIRPVMIMGDQPSSYAPLVKTVGPPLPNPPPYDQTGVWVLPSFGPRLDAIAPERSTLPATLTLQGSDLGEVDQVLVGPLTLAAGQAPGGGVTATIPAAATLSAGSYPVTVGRPFASHTISSNTLLLHVLPRLATATPSGLTAVSPPTDLRVFGHLSLTGVRLGGPGDSIFIAFFGAGDFAVMFEAQGVPTQDTLDIDVPIAKALDPGTYRIILRVNGEQADDAIAVNWS